MRIMVISDTHIPVAAEGLPPEVIAELKKSDMCLHAGDLIESRVMDEISRYTTFKGVQGNMDSKQVLKALPERLVIEVEGVTIGLTHGSGSPFDILSRVKKTFTEDIDIYVFGHTHTAYDKTHKGKIFFNPGSLTDKFFAKANSYGILEIKGTKISRKIITI
ncbi:metallophosphoesterase family protein [Candidatus Omnitrophota bacterium]